MGFKNILFDLDGTLTDPGIGITNAVLYAQGKLGLPLSKREELYKFIGPPLTDSFQEFWGLNGEQSREALKYYREYFVPRGMFENAVYPGMEAFLQALRDGGKRLYVATSKPEPLATAILAHFSLDKYFIGTAGSTLEETRTKKSEVILYALAEFKLDLADTVMVGDRFHDVQGARAAALPCIGVSYGYGGEKELREAGAIAVAANLKELKELLLQD